MPTTVIFENALLADAVNKAARVAPNKGAAFDKAAGLMFVIDPRKQYAMVRATDLEISFEQEVPTSESQGDPVNWRIPSAILQSLVSTLPMHEGSTVKFEDRGDEAIRFKSGRTIAKLNMLEIDAFPEEIFVWEEGMMSDAGDMAFKVEQVSWACDKRSHILSGVHLDGEYMYGCNTSVLSVIPAKVELPEPVTVPLDPISVILKSASNCQVRKLDHRFQIALDEHTRSTTALLEAKYPNVRAVMREDFTQSMKVHRQGFLDSLGRLMVLARNEKLPTLSIEINGAGLVKTLTFDLDIPGVGRMQDSIDVETEFSESWDVGMVPANLLAAVDHTRGDYVHIDFGHPDPDKWKLLPIQVRDIHGYRCYVMPKAKG